MAETADQIRNEIEQARLRLSYDIAAVERKVRYEADWRVQFDRRPWAFLGAVFGLATMAGWVFHGRAR